MNSLELDSSTTFTSAPRRWAALGVLIAVILILSINNTVLALAVPALTADLAPSAEQILWIGDIYSLTLAGLLVTMGTLSDRIGRKRLLLMGISLFAVASLIAAFSSSAEMLIAARVLLGIGAAAMMPPTLALIRTIFTNPKERTRAIAIWSAAFGGGTAIGPLVGGALLESFPWGSVFLINVPVMIIVIVAGFFLLPESKDPKPGRFDLTSAALITVSLVALVYALKHGVKSGFDLELVVSLVIGITAVVLFVRRQNRLETPFLDVSLFKIPAFSGAVLANLISIFALSGLLFFFSQYLQLARGLSPLQAGIGELPITITSMVVIVLVGILLRRLGRGRAVALGLLLTATGLVFLGFSAGTAEFFWLVLALIPIGLGVGIASTLTADAIVSAAPPNKAGGVASISETANELGIVLGIAIMGSVLSLVYRANLVIPGGTSDADTSAAQDSLASTLAAVDPGSALGEAARAAFVDAIQFVSFTAAAITFIAALVAWRFIPSKADVNPGSHDAPTDGTSTGDAQGTRTTSGTDTASTVTQNA